MALGALAYLIVALVKPERF
nr:potassium-transporting ATPase subunit F [Leucobacter sp. L43]